MVDLFNAILINPIINALLLFHFVFDKIGVPGVFGFSIIALTVGIRLLLNPFYFQQIKLAKKMEEMKPHLDILSKKHKGDKKKLQEEQLRLYKKMGVNPASGCLFAIVQIPIFIGLYRVLLLFLSNGAASSISKQVNKIAYIDLLKVQSIDPMFFGFNLAQSPSNFQKLGIYYLAVPVVTAILQYLQVKYATPTPSRKDGKSKKDKKDDFSSVMSSQMKIMFPIMIAYFSFILPVGLAIYWNVFSLFSLFQYYKVRSAKAAAKA